MLPLKKPTMVRHARLGSGPDAPTLPPCQTLASISTNSVIGGRSERPTLAANDMTEAAHQLHQGNRL
jgi:hypothetical protein